MMSSSWAYAAGIQARNSDRSRGVRTPETTSSPCASMRKSPLGSGAPVTSSREKATPEPEVGPLVAVDHLLDVDRRAPFVGDVVDPPVGDGALAHPRIEDRADGLLELLAGIGGEVVERLEAPGQLAQGVGVELGVQAHAALALDPRDLVLEARARHAAHDVAEHLHEPAVGVPCEARVAGARGQPLDRLVVEARGSGRCPSFPASSRARRCARRPAAGRAGRPATCRRAPPGARAPRRSPTRGPPGPSGRRACTPRMPRS